jgi:hypothetical protein
LFAPQRAFFTDSSKNPVFRPAAGEQVGDAVSINADGVSRVN